MTPDEVLTVAQLYRDRATGENNFDKLKNHWGWGGFTTRDLQRCRLIARIVALIYNWWTLLRLADPDQHTEAITSRPLLLYAVGRPRHANQTSITITSTQRQGRRVRRILAEVAAFFTSLRPAPEQLTLTALERWSRILSRAPVKYLKGRQLGPRPAPCLPDPTR